MTKVINICLAMSWNSSLSAWNKSEILTREILIYKKLLKENKISNLYLISYSSEDHKILNNLIKKSNLYKKISLITPPRWIEKSLILKFLWALTFPLFNKKNICLYLTHQLDGTIPYLLRNFSTESKIIIRSGYLPSLHRTIYKGEKSFSVLAYKFLEKISFNLANYIFVTSLCDKNLIIKNYKIEHEKIYCIKNFVDTTKFKYNNLNKKFEDRYLYVGRLSKEKNLLNLIKSLANTKITLDIVGSGNFKELIKNEASKYFVKINFLGKFSNDFLPDIYSKYKYFILPSYSEGSPKALLEAMACGLICITTPVKGILEIINDKRNGILCKGFQSYDIKTAINTIDEINEKYISQNARNFIIDNHSFEKVSEDYLNVIREII